jgi:hypothetical protein
MSSTTFELCGPGDSRPRPDDLFVKALSVQGGEANIGGESTPFARIVMTGVELKHATADPHALRRQFGVVLKLEHAAAFAAELRRILNDMVRASRTPTVPSSGIWSWTSVPLAAEDMMVAQVTASGTAVALVAGPTPTVRVDFLGTLVHGLASSSPALHVHGAVFSGPRQVQSLISSLRKVVDSALERQRRDAYVAAGRAADRLRLLTAV